MKLDCNITEETFLYHGTLSFYEKYFSKYGVQIIGRSDIKADFGDGFYLTVDNKEQAAKWALDAFTKYRFNKSVAKYYGFSYREFVEAQVQTKAVLMVYKINDIFTFNNLNHKTFSISNDEWKNYIADNRNGKTTKKYDWVYGPVADGGVRSEYVEAWKVKPWEDYNQISINSEEAIKYLTLVEVVVC